MFTETIPMAIKLDSKFEFGINMLQSHSANSLESTKSFQNSSSAIKLELEREDPKPLEYASTSSFSEFTAFAAAAGHSGTNASPDSKDWLSEARRHRERQRVSTAKRRANMTPDQRKKERERARIKQAQRRALRTEEQIQAQRERDRVRQAMKRARYRQVEMTQQEQSQLQHEPPQLDLQGQTTNHPHELSTFPLEERINQLTG